MNKKLLALLTTGLLVCAPFYSSFPLFGNDDMTAPRLSDSETVQTAPDTLLGTNDTLLATTVKNAFIADRSLAPQAALIDVKADKGVITLIGTVDTPKAKQDFELKAKNIDGVKNVINNLDIRR